MGHRVTSELRDAYLSRLGLEAAPPSAEALRRLHMRHVERIPYETIWLHAGENWGIDPIDSVTRIALGGRGGYCYHLNGAFAVLLASLGYAVTLHSGAVHGPAGADEESLGNHVVLTVRGLPSDGNASGIWYVDVGLGDALFEPLRLVAGRYEQPPFHLTLDGPQDSRDAWHLTHDPTGGFVGMGWTSGEVSMSQFGAMHAWLSTSPDSPFASVAMAETRDATGVDVIRGLVLARIGDRPSTSEPLTRRSDWFGALADVFGLRLDGVDVEARNRLWARVRSAHDAWEDSSSG